MCNQLNIINMDIGRIYYSFKQIIADNLFFIFNFFYIRLYFIIIFSLNIFLWLLVYSININFSRELIVLHYNVDFGVDMIGPVNNLYIIPLAHLIILIINILIIFYSVKYKYFKFIVHILLLAGLVVGIFLLIALSFIYLINFK